MGEWTGEFRLDVESFILNRAQIVHLDDFARNHQKYLVSISANPKEARKCWFAQRSQTTPGEGWVSMRLNGQEIMPLDAWTNVEYFWLNIIDAVQEYLATGYGHGGFSDENACFTIQRKTPTLAVFCLRGNNHILHPQPLLRALLDGAASFYQWHHKHVGTLPPVYSQTTRKLIAQLELNAV